MPKHTASTARAWPKISSSGASSSVVLKAKPAGSVRRTSAARGSGLGGAILGHAPLDVAAQASGLYPLHVVIGKPEMMADLVDHDMADDARKMFARIAPIVEDRPAVEEDHVDVLGRLHDAPLIERQAAIEAQEVEGRFEPHLLLGLLVREFLDPQHQAARLPAQLVRQRGHRLARHRLDLLERRRCPVGCPFRVGHHGPHHRAFSLPRHRSVALARRHPEGTVEAHHRPVQHLIPDHVEDKAGELGRPARARGVGHRGAEAGLLAGRQTLEQRGREDAGSDAQHPDASWPSSRAAGSVSAATPASTRHRQPGLAGLRSPRSSPRSRSRRARRPAPPATSPCRRPRAASC